MTLNSVIVDLGKAATNPEILFVALSRVRHSDDLLLEDNFPDFRSIMVQRKHERFATRQNWEKLARVKFSKTIRTYMHDATLFNVEKVCVLDQLMD